jgi:pilus assembly protein Flp/PilA
MLVRFLRDESGATAIEYGLIAAGILRAIITVVDAPGVKLNAKFTSIQYIAEIGPGGHQAIATRAYEMYAHALDNIPRII